jgi:tetratricopeptide (TPR) repeat protein
MAKKIVRKDLDTPDKFQTYSQRFIRYLVENKNKLYALLAVIVLSTLISGGLYYYRALNDQKAQEMYATAYNSYKALKYDGEKELYSKSAQYYEDIIKQYPGTNAALLAYYDLGNIYFFIDEIDMAVDAYKKFLQKYSRDDVFTALAYYGLGYCYEAKKDFPNALDSYEKSNSYNIGDSYLAMNYGNIARVYEEMNKPEKAEEYYKKALDKTSDPISERLLKRKLSMIAYK